MSKEYIRSEYIRLRTQSLLETKDECWSDAKIFEVAHKCETVD